jgi:hypothetical protein
MGWSEDTLQYWHKYAIADASFYALYLLIALDILLWSTIASIRERLPKRVRMMKFSPPSSLLTIEIAGDMSFVPHHSRTHSQCRLGLLHFHQVQGYEHWQTVCVQHRFVGTKSGVLSFDGGHIRWGHDAKA